MTRDIDANPYSKDEMRVAKWFVERCDIGGGDDPIGFLLASYETLLNERERLRKKLASPDAPDGRLDDRTNADYPEGD